MTVLCIYIVYHTCLNIHMPISMLIISLYLYVCHRLGHRHNKLFTHTHNTQYTPTHTNTRKIQLAKIINVYPKCKIIFGVIKLSVFQMLSILEKFSLLLLVKLSLFILFASFLYCSPYNSNSFSLFKAIATSFP